MSVSLDAIKELAESILYPLEQYVRSNICWDPNSPYYGGLLETIPHTPQPTWPHASYVTADAYLKLYEAYRKPEYWEVAKVMVNYLVREQSDAGCWYGYTGYPKSFGWNEKNAPPGSKLNVVFEDGTVLDIIREPFSIFGTVLYGKVVVNAYEVAVKNNLDLSEAEHWRISFLKAAEFMCHMIDNKGYWVGNRAWNQRAAVAVLLFTASRLLCPERYLRKAKIVLDQILEAQLESGEYLYSETGGRTYHYHALTLYFLNQVNREYPSKRVEEAVLKGLKWMWSMQKENGDFDWSIHSPKDHKTRLFSTFGIALAATAPYLKLFKENVYKTLVFLKKHQNPNGGFPRKIGLEKTDNVASGEILHGLAELIKALE